MPGPLLCPSTEKLATTSLDEGLYGLIFVNLGFIVACLGVLGFWLFIICTILGTFGLKTDEAADSRLVKQQQGGPRLITLQTESPLDF